jgi:hypothetical protein
MKQYNNNNNNNNGFIYLFNLSSFTISEANYQLTFGYQWFSLFLFYLQLNIFYFTKQFIFNYV